MQPDRSTDNPPLSESALRPTETVALIAWTLITFYVSARVVGPHLLLLSIYGWSRVQHEHLSMLRMSKHSVWLVSNGDTVDSATAVFYDVLWVTCNFLSVAAFYWLLRVRRFRRSLRAALRPVA